MTRRLLPVLIACGAAVTGCGGGGGGRPATTAGSTGRALFSQACGACHTLTGHDDPRHQGGDLRNFHADRRQFNQLASEMPVRRPLTRAQLRAVVDYVMAVERASS